MDDNNESEKQPMAKMTLFQPPTPVSTFRRLMPQILASAAKNMLIMDLAMAINFPTVAIPQLVGLKNRDPEEFLTLNNFQASWFASIAFICQPIGSFLSGIVLEHLGRKWSMILVNIPHIVAWLMLYYATDLNMFFMADILLGLGIGFMEAPVLTYVGEIAEPSVRGVLTAVSGVSYALGASILYAVGRVLNWRQTALILCSVPVLTIIAISFVPETPMWLLTKNRKREALKSLQWLRGWVAPEHVREEFEQLDRYVQTSNKSRHGDELPSFSEKVRDMGRRSTRRPLFIIIFLFFFAAFNVINSMRAYYVQIFDKYNIAVGSGMMTVYIGTMATTANIACSICIKLLGKRKITIFSMFSTAIFCCTLTIYTWRRLPRGLSSFDVVPVDLESVTYTPMVIFMCLAFFTNFGITAIPWIMVGEIFPTKTRSMAGGLVAGIYYTMSFISAKTYYSLETTLSLFGICLMYTILASIGTAFLYFFLPETEGRSLEEIEDHFSDKTLRLRDHKIVSQKLLKTDDVTIKA